MFVKLTNGQPSKFPYTLGELRRDNPSTSFPKTIDDATLASYDVYPVTVTPVPVVDIKTHAVKQQAKLVDGVWTQVWQIQKLSEERAAANIRGERNRRLANCDWTQLPDAPVTAAPWAAYRQALRDISDQAGFPWEVTWPEEPA